MDTIQTAAILRLYAMAVLLGSMIPLIMRGFHACKNTREPAINAFIATIVGIGLNIVLIGPLGAEGLALAYSLANLLGLLLLLISFSKKIGTLGLRRNLLEFTKIVAAAVIMGFGTWFAMRLLPLMDVSFLQSVLICATLVIVAAVFYGGLLLVMRSKIAHENFIKLRKRYF